MPRRDPYRKRLQNLLNREALKTLEKIRSTVETPEEIYSCIDDFAPGGRIEKLMKLRDSR